MLTRLRVGGREQAVTEATEPAARPREDKQLAEELVERAREEGVELVGPGGLLSGLTKNVLEASLEAEMSEHLGYEKHDPAGREKGSNSRNGPRSKTLLTDVGPVEIEVPRAGGEPAAQVVVLPRRHLPQLLQVIVLGRLRQTQHDTPRPRLGATGCRCVWS